MTPEEFERREYARKMAEAMPHGPDEPCTCDGFYTNCWCTNAKTPEQGAAAQAKHEQKCRCECWPGHRLGCTCDIAWDTAFELMRDRY